MGCYTKSSERDLLKPVSRALLKGQLGQIEMTDFVGNFGAFQ
jgi:hypothetical protein